MRVFIGHHTHQAYRGCLRHRHVLNLVPHRLGSASHQINMPPGGRVQALQSLGQMEECIGSEQGGVGI